MAEGIVAVFTVRLETRLEIVWLGFLKPQLFCSIIVNLVLVYANLSLLFILFMCENPLLESDLNLKQFAFSYFCVFLMLQTCNIPANLYFVFRTPWILKVRFDYIVFKAVIDYCAHVCACKLQETRTSDVVLQASVQASLWSDWRPSRGWTDGASIRWPTLSAISLPARLSLTPTTTNVVDDDVYKQQWRPYAMYFHHWASLCSRSYLRCDDFTVVDTIAFVSFSWNAVTEDVGKTFRRRRCHRRFSFFIAEGRRMERHAHQFFLLTRKVIWWHRTGEQSTSFVCNVTASHMDNETPTYERCIVNYSHPCYCHSVMTFFSLSFDPKTWCFIRGIYTQCISQVNTSIAL